MTENKTILVFGETTGGRLSPSTYELLGAGRSLAKASGHELAAVLIGSELQPAAQEAVSLGVDLVYRVENSSLKDYSAELYLAALEKAVIHTGPEIVLLSQTAAGKDLAPGLAFRFNTSAAMDCTALEIDPASRRLLMTRPVYGGNAQAVQVCSTNPQIAALRRKSFVPASPESSRQGKVVQIDYAFSPEDCKTRLVEHRVEPATGVKLEDARVVVAGGRGIGSAEGFKQLEELAGILNGAVGATRPPCDRGWIADTRQIGLTGKIVSPDLYLAIGISGASQHLSGFSGAKMVVAINKDPEANIFRAAHYGIKGDWKIVAPLLSAALKKAVNKT
ncbi:MAG TPA: electron transfer flavoprotein subunit alpha/FixB family protein [Dehalococcoidales bacterium]|nr:electron transfer flavoprotein subunit alpha/FixB family protein [Dehalococcoidales bacterium]